MADSSPFSQLLTACFPPVLRRSRFPVALACLRDFRPARSRSLGHYFLLADNTYGKPCQRSRVGEWGSDLTGNWIALAGLSDRRSAIS
jgi:hypothetical protein